MSPGVNLFQEFCVFIVAALMKNKAVRQIPVSDNQSRPIGLLDASDALQVLLKKAEYEEDLLRDYVMGIGYR